MPTEDLIEAILTEANETAEKIIQDAKKGVQNTIEEHRKKGRERAKELTISIEEKAQKDASIIKLREIAAAESKAKWVIEGKKNALIDDVLNKVKDELRTWIKKENYIQFLENLIVEGGITIGVPDLELILNKRDSTLPLDLDKLAVKIGKKTELKTNITKSAINIDTIGGAIIQMPDDDLPKEFYKNNPSLKLITETNSITKFKEVLKTYVEKQMLPNIEDSFSLKVLKDLLNNYRKIDSLENRNGNIIINKTFEGIMDNKDRELRFEIAKILFP